MYLSSYFAGRSPIRRREAGKEKKKPQHEVRTSPFLE
jgi:hypothetical protein